MKISFLAEEFDCGNQIGVAVALVGDEVPDGQIRTAIALPSRQEPVGDVALQIAKLRSLATWIENKERELNKPREAA